MYIRIKIDGTSYLAHRLAFLYMSGIMPSNTVDHINSNGLDNSWINLRDVSIGENNKNMSIRSDNTSGVSGVTRHSKKDKWVAQISVGGINTYLGYYNHLEDAAEARRLAEIKYNFHRNHGVKYD